MKRIEHETYPALNGGRNIRTVNTGQGSEHICVVSGTLGEKAALEKADFIVKACNAHDDMVKLCKILVQTFPETDCSKLDASYFVDNCCNTIAAAEKAAEILKKVGEIE